MDPINVACGECFAQPGHLCSGVPPNPPLIPEMKFHFARIEAAGFIGAVDDELAGVKTAEPTTEEFDKAVLASGEI